MYTDNDGQDTLPDESTREVIDYCRSIQGKDLEVFKLLTSREAVREIKDVIGFFADYSEPVTEDELIDDESGPEALLDLISVLRTTEALIRVRKSLPTSGLPAKDLGELDSELSETIDQGAALLVTFFQNDHRYFYEAIGDFDRHAAEIGIALADKLTGGER